MSVPMTLSIIATQSSPGFRRNYKPVTTSIKCCCTSRQWHQEVWPGLSRLMHQDLHWLDIPERVKYKLGTHWCLLGKAPVYLSNCCILVAQVATRRQWHLRSTARHQLTVPRHRLSTFGRRAFAVAGPTMFNALPNDLWDPSVNTTTFGQSMKTHLFSAYRHV